MFRRDVWPALALAGAACMPGIRHLGLAVGELSLRPLNGFGVLLILAQSLPLAVRRRWPATVLAVVGVAFGVFQVAGFPISVAGLGLMVALYSAGAHQARRRLVTSVTALLAYAVLAVILHLRDAPDQPFALTTFVFVLAAPWAAGGWVRARQQQAARAAERTRIARELHDVVTHHVTAMVVQADAAQYLDKPGAAAALTEISGTGRRALTELRHLLGVLDGADSPHSPVQLVAGSRAAGQPVEWVEEGTPAGLGGGADLAIYRVVQEGLTNAMKHAPGRPTTVRMRYEADGTHIEVVTAGSADGPVTPGRGLTGLRERVGAAGGSFDAGRTNRGDFRIAAHLPAGAAS